MHFSSDNAAAVHPRVWTAMLAADAADMPYDGDMLSCALFGRECTVLAKAIAAL